MLPSGEKTVESTSLKFPSVSRSDAGTYICTADNGVGPPVTAVIDLNVICKYQQINPPSQTKKHNCDENCEQDACHDAKVLKTQEGYDKGC